MLIALCIQFEMHASSAGNFYPHVHVKACILFCLNLNIVLQRSAPAFEINAAGDLRPAHHVLNQIECWPPLGRFLGFEISERQLPGHDAEHHERNGA